VIGQCHARHRHQKCLKFLRCLDAAYPAPLTLHMVMDSDGPHKTPAVQAWPAEYPRFVCHFEPTSSSWLNLVERWFRELTDKVVRRGVFPSVPILIAVIEAFLASWHSAQSPSSGRRRWATSWRNSTELVSAWRRFSRGVRSRAAAKRRRLSLYSYFGDTTLAPSFRRDEAPGHALCGDKVLGRIHVLPRDVAD